MTAHRRLPRALLSLLAVLGGSALGLAACDSGDTVVALNVNFAPSASTARRITVDIAQPGQGMIEVMLMLPTKDSDAGPVLKDNRFVQRITLLDSYTDVETTITVLATDSAGKNVDTAKATFNPRPNEAIAAFVTVGKDPSKNPTTPTGENDAGAEDTATTANAATAAGTAAGHQTVAGAAAGGAAGAAAAGEGAAGAEAAAGAAGK